MYPRRITTGGGAAMQQESEREPDGIGKVLLWGIAGGLLGLAIVAVGVFVYEYVSHYVL